MKITHTLLPIIFSVFCWSTQVFAQSDKHQDISQEYQISEQLNLPFGTIVNLKVEIVSGESLRMKEYQSSYLFLIKEIDGTPLADSLIMTFADETETFPSDDFELYEWLYGEEVGRLSSETINEMQKQYVGKIFDVIAYETGAFAGDPEGVYNYQMARQSSGFHFRNWLIVISNESMK